MADLYSVFAEDLDGNRRFINKAYAGNGGNSLFDLYANECDGDGEQIVIVRVIPMTMRSKITVRWTTNPADMGYDGKKSNWLSEKGQTMGVRKAVEFAHDLGQKVGQGTNKKIDYKHNRQPVSLSEIEDVISASEARKAGY